MKFRKKAKISSGRSAERKGFRVTARHLAGAAYGAVLGFFAFRGVIGTAACAVLFAVIMQGGRSGEQRRRQIVRQSADLLESMSSMLSAGRSVFRSLTGACDELEDVYRCSGVTDMPVIEAVRSRRPMSDRDCSGVFSELGIAAGAPELTAFAGAMDIMRDKGGNTAELCADTCDALRRKCDLADEIVTLRTDVDLSRAILMIMVPVVLIVFNMVGPDFLSPL